MTRRLWIAGLALVALLAGVFLGGQGRGGPASDDRPAFTLNGPDGPLALQDLRGKVVLLNFGYTFCPDICPTGLAALALGMDKLTPAERGQLAVLFITLDPARDDLARLKEYTAFFSPAMTGLTGEQAAIDQAARQFGVVYARHAAEAGGSYTIDHSADTYIVNREGRLVGRIGHALAPDRFVEALKPHL